MVDGKIESTRQEMIDKAAKSTLEKPKTDDNGNEPVIHKIDKELKEVLKNANPGNGPGVAQSPEITAQDLTRQVKENNAQLEQAALQKIQGILQQCNCRIRAFAIYSDDKFTVGWNVVTKG